jgi:tetratricopeptide (TPR) repeat protein
VEYIEPHMFKDNVRHLLSVGMMYENLWLRYGKKDADYAKAEGYYRAALAIGPKLPPVLYSLANLYNEKGDLTKGREIKAMILNLWPNEGNIVNFFN